MKSHLYQQVEAWSSNPKSLLKENNKQEILDVNHKIVAQIPYKRKPLTLCDIPCISGCR
jgi:hypothetical protein